MSPVQPISESASNVTKPTVVDGHMCFDGNPVSSIDAKQVLLEFVNFLKEIANLALVGYNIKPFDLMFMHHHLS